MSRHYSYEIADLTEKLKQFIAATGSSTDARARYMADAANKFLQLCGAFYHNDFDDALKLALHDFKIREAQAEIANAEARLGRAKRTLEAIEGEGV